MPRLRETPEQLANRAFREALAAGLARKDMTQRAVAGLLRLTQQTLSRYKGAPEKLTVRSLRQLNRLGLLTPEDIQRMICY